MWSDVLTVLAGVAVGLATGFFFERRALNEARNNARELQEEVRVLREALYTVGGSIEERSDMESSTIELEAEVSQWVADFQNFQGRVSRSRLVSHFVKGGRSGKEIHEALTKLVESGKIAITGNWIEMR